ncbi:MAG: hypothetical protein DMF56_02195 [Acidobacteria bacterium]|nr:MAG: hypothetical protein DMF56_02195 [Acidobacteriota bacterium]
MVERAAAPVRGRGRSRRAQRHSDCVAILGSRRRRRAAVDLEVGRRRADRGRIAARGGTDWNDAEREADPLLSLADGARVPMIRAQSIAAFLLAVIGPTLLFWMVIHQVSGLWLDVALRPEVRQALQQSMEDQKRLRSMDAAHRDAYRKRFETTGTLLHRLDVIRMNRAQMLQRFEITVVAIFALVAIVVAASVTMRARRARALEQKQYLDRVSVLQENARRHAHETKGPLTAARLELERAGDALRGGATDDVANALQSVADEIDRLSRLTRNQASFAAIGRPVLREVSLRTAVEEFCATFADAWPNVTLRCSGGDATVCADRDMLRQVLVNLCTNSALAMEGERASRPPTGGGQDARSPHGTITFAISKRAIDVTDTGGGIAESLRARVFDPYVTTRRTGEGMGLGLAISRKIMLDHGGDLQLASTSNVGTTFRVLFGDKECS